MIYFKGRSDFVTYRKADVISYDICLDSYKDDASVVIAPWGAADMDDIGAWLIRKSRPYLISAVSPADDSVTIRIMPPQKVFDREIVYPGEGASTAAFLASVIQTEFINQSDPMYRVAALRVVQDTDRAFIKPDEVLDAEAELAEGEAPGTVLFNLYDYVVKLRNCHDVFVDFSVSGDVLTATIREHVFRTYNVVFGDGHSVLDSQSFGDADTTAKVTVFRGNAATDFYLKEDGAITTEPPSPRVPGAWATVLADEDASEEDIEELAEDAFGDGCGAHKVEFWSDVDLALGDVVTMRLDGKRVVGSVSRIDEASGNVRRHYATGDLATMLTEQI